MQQTAPRSRPRYTTYPPLATAMSRALRRSIAALGLTTSVLLPAPATAQARRPMALEDLITAVRVGDPQLSPDVACSSCARPPTRPAASATPTSGWCRPTARRPRDRSSKDRRARTPRASSPTTGSCSSRRVMAHRSSTSPMERAGTRAPSRRSAPVFSRRSSCPPTDAWSRSCPMRIHAAAMRRAMPAHATRSRRIPSRCTG